MSEAPDADTREGTVVEIHGMLVTLLLPSGERLRARPPRDRTTPAIGDRAIYTFDSGEARITALAERERNYLRPNAQGGQLVATHVDRLVIVTAVDPGPRPGLIDRMWIAVDPEVEIILALNKCDLPGADAAARELDDHVAAGARRILTSVRSGAGIAELRAAIDRGLTLLVGHSGVGKSSLVNALVPGAALATGAVNDFTSKGRHTTTVATCHALGPGQLVVDTPGVRAFSLEGLPLHDIARRFPGFAGPSERCHFGRCLHESEPGCAVRESQPPERLARYEALLAVLRDEASGGSRRARKEEVAASRTQRYPEKKGGKMPPPRRR